MVGCICPNQAPTMQGCVVCLAVSPLGPGSALAKSSPWPGATDTRKTSVSGEPDSLGARRCTARLVFLAFATTKHVRQVTVQVTKQQLKTTRLDKCRYPIIAILHVSSLSHGSLALGYEPGWVDTETNHALNAGMCSPSAMVCIFVAQTTH